ncbi:hypothetical protein, partial [Nitrospirillum amazonense]|uniref:hypothetical protein n=1 Tax=Nitrospirillum amazonense TaxID=28077 RepID=UPI002412D98D
YSNTEDLTAPFTWALIFREASGGSSNVGLFGKWSSSTQQSNIGRSGGAMAFRHGNDVGAGIVSFPNLYDTWRLAICSSNGTVCRAIVDGVRLTDSATNDTAATGTLYLGGFWGTDSFGFGGQVADVMMFNEDIIGNNPGALALVLDYAKLYGIGA